MHRDFPELNVYFQNKGYFDSHVCLQAGNDFVDSLPEEGKWLVCSDNLGAHATEEYKDLLENEGNCTLLFTPKNCTDICAVTNAGLGKSVKHWLGSVSNVILRRIYKPGLRDELTQRHGDVCTVSGYAILCLSFMSKTDKGKCCRLSKCVAWLVLTTVPRTI